MQNSRSPDYSDDVDAKRSTFETTEWSVVRAAAAEGDSAPAQAALESLCRKYWLPLFVYVRRRGYSAPDAQDLVQGFFARILKRRDLQGVRREHGRFRSYLLVALKNFMLNEGKRSETVKRGGGQVPIALDDLMKLRDVPIPGDEQSPDRIFDQQWAIALLERVLTQLREEHRALGKESQFEALQCFLLGHGHTRSQAEIAREFQMTEGAVKQAAFRLRQRYQYLLRAEVSDTVTTLPEVEEELRHLVRVLRS